MDTNAGFFMDVSQLDKHDRLLLANGALLPLETAAGLGVRWPSDGFWEECTYFSWNGDVAGKRFNAEEATLQGWPVIPSDQVKELVKELTP